MRIGGIGSGMDTEAMLEQLMEAERMPLDRLQQQKQVLEWQHEDYRQINSKMLSFRNSVSDMRFSNNMLRRSTTSSDESVVTASASSNAQDGNYNVNVKSLAQRSFAQSSELNLEEGKPLTELFGESLEENITIQTSGEKVTFSFKTSSEIEELKENGELEQGVLYVDKEGSLDEFLRTVNNSEAGVHMFYDSSEGRMFINSTETGADNTIDVSGSLFIDALGINEDNTETGKNASVNINGFNINPQGNDFEFGGINYSIKSIGTATASVGRDNDHLFDQVKGFVDEYNKVLLSLNGKLNEPLHRDYPPLTDEQKRHLSDREIEQWEELSRSGHLRNDSILSRSATNIRRVISTQVDGDFRTLSQIGIETRDYREGGVLHIDEQKLRDAIEENPRGVFELFAGNENSDGIASEMRTNLRRGMDQIGNRAGSSDNIDRQSFIGRSMRDIDDRIDRMEDRLARVEQRYWDQFTAMESALYEMYSQGDWLQQQLMSM
ncbi:flagellar filament capping protein FliD [Proteinivorax hydrogeniformans]|uniref:Flagellar hook-associated protein 2 n=1 Tax=Proteinivorax hydrogeniformans TaxID=1826727 RepID=A0AAU8HUY1_9FIRM